MLHKRTSLFGGLVALAIGLVPWLAQAQGPSTRSGLEARSGPPVGMVGFTRESAEAFHETKPAKPVVVTVAKSAPPAPAVNKPPVRHEAPAPVTARRSVEKSERPAPVRRETSKIVARQERNRWPRLLRGRWAGPLERVHVWWNEHFDRRHFDWPGNPPRRAA